MIQARDLTKRYGPHLALDHVDFDVGQGRVAGFLGLNGAGKTTTLRIAACYMPPTSGSLSVAGHDSVRESDQVRRRIGYLPERVPLYEDLRVHEYLRYRARLKGLRAQEARRAVARVIGRCGLEDRKSSLIGSLSKGLRQRVGIADALVHSPSLLILDEPTSGLDPDQRIALRGLIREVAQEHTVFLSTHILPEAEAVCDDLIIIHRGRIRATGSLDEMRSGADQGFLVTHMGAPLATYGAEALDIRQAAGRTTLRISAEGSLSRAVECVLRDGRDLIEAKPILPSLEDVFIALTTGREEPA